MSLWEKKSFSLEVVGLPFLHRLLSGIQREYPVGIIIGFDHDNGHVLSINHSVSYREKKHSRSRTGLQSVMQLGLKWQKAIILHKTDESFSQ